MPRRAGQRDRRDSLKRGGRRPFNITASEALESRKLLSGTLSYTVSAGAGTDQLVVAVSGGKIHINEGSVTVAEQDLAATTAVAIDAAARATSLRIDYAAGPMQLPITFNAGSGLANSLRIAGGSFALETTDLTASYGGTIKLDAATITFSNVQLVSDTSTAVSNAINVPQVVGWQTCWISNSAIDGTPALVISDTNQQFASTEVTNKQNVSIGMSSFGDQVYMYDAVAPAGIDSLTLVGGTGETDLDLFQLQVPMNYTAVGGISHLLVNVGSAIASPLTVGGPPQGKGFTTLEELAPPDRLPRTITVSPTGITGTGAAPILFGSGTLGTITLHTSPVANTINIPDLSGFVALEPGYTPGTNFVQTVNVASTEPGSSLSLTALGPVQVNLGEGGSAQQIRGSISFDGGPDSLIQCTIDDSTDATERDASLSDPTTGIIPGTMSWPYNGNTRVVVTVNGGSGGNTYDIVPTIDNRFIVNAGAGVDKFVIQGGSVEANGGGGDDQFTIQYENSLPLTFISIDGGTGNNSLRFVTSPTLSLQVGATQATGVAGMYTSSFAYANVSVLELAGGAPYVTTGDLGSAFALAVDGGSTLTLESAQNLADLEIGASAVVIVSRSDPATSATLSTTGLQIDPGGKLDLRADNLRISYENDQSPAASVRNWIATGYHGGDWQGEGITSTVLGRSYGLAIVDSPNGPGSGFAGSNVIVQPALRGDCNLDGAVTFGDLLILVQGYGYSGATWSDGDFDYDGRVGFADLLALAQNYQGTVTTAVAPVGLWPTTSIAEETGVNERPLRRKGLGLLS